ncbi:MAG: hypothetical protein RLZZ262_2101 [Bacteroidota bacterium]|jgi:hypothetical protein
MKTIAHIAILLLAMMPAALIAQMDNERGERIAELRKSFIAERLALTPEQDQQFWPMYDKYVAERKGVTKKIRKSQLLIDNGGLTDAELRKAIDELTAQRKVEADLDANFIKNAIPIIGVEKASQLALIEREFKKTLMRKIRERRQQRK